MKTIFGINSRAYIRQLLCAILIFIAIYAFISLPILNIDANSPELLISFTINTVLYPFARYTYEAILDYIIGSKTELWISMKLLIIEKTVSLIFCWALAIVLVMIGLISKRLINKTTAN